jgi:hypothetical protein
VRTPLVLALSLAAAACVTPPLSPGLDVSKQDAGSCTSVCDRLGMRLGAVVVVVNSVGCVCEPQGAAGAAPTARGGAAASAAAVIVATRNASASSTAVAPPTPAASRVPPR